ncbi:MAG: sulfatase-like hydrolase/transferase [Roseburia sp.]|nr:sulfatase-like hydrolase/transferase [Roseburia sp.]
MPEAITLAVQIALAVFGGTVTTGILVFYKKVRKDGFLFASWLLYAFSYFWVFNAARSLLLCGDRILAYSVDKYLLPTDLLLLAGAVAFVCCTAEEEKESRTALKAVPCMALFLYYAACLISGIVRYGNLNAAVYDTFLLGRTTCLGAAVLIGRLLYKRIREADFKKQKYGLEISVSALVVVTFFLCPTFETLLTNMREFSFSLSAVWHRFILVGVGVWGAGVGFLLLLGERKRRVFLSAAWILSIAGYLQGMLLNNRLFLMDGKRMEWSDRLKLGNLLAWCVLCVLLAGLCLWLKTAGRKLMTMVSVVLCLMQTIGIVSLLPSYSAEAGREDDIDRNYLSTQGLFEVASEENVIIIVPDTFDVDYMDEILAQYPDFLEPLKGFIYFPDMVSQFPRTTPSITYMLTEEEYFYEIPQSEYADAAFSQCAFWRQLQEKGWQYYFFEYERDTIGGSVLKNAANFVEQGTVIDKRISTPGCAETMLRIGNYRLLPYFLKEYYIYTSADINRLIIRERVLEVPIYEADDARHWQELKRTGLKVAEEDRALRFIHMDGAHSPYNMNEFGERVREEDNSRMQQCMGSMNFIYEYLKELQETGAYEQSMIIITADHGENYMSEQLEQNTNPVLFIKPFGAGADRELRISDVYASQNDLLPTVCAALGLQYDTAWGLNLSDTRGADKERVRYHYYTVVEDTVQTKVRTYKITGSSLDFKNWEATEEYREFGKYR